MLTYTYLTLHIVPGPQSHSYFIPIALLPIALLIPRNVLSRWRSICLFMPLIVASTVHAWVQMNGVDVISVDVLLWSLYLLALKDPWNDFRYVGLTQNRRAQRQPSENAELLDKRECAGVSYPPALLERLPWVGTVLVSIRLHGWKIGQPSHVELHSRTGGFEASRAGFVKKSLTSFVRGYLALDVARAYQTFDPYFNDLSTSISSPLSFDGIQILPLQLFRSFIIAAQGWALLSQLMYLPCLLLVGLNAMRCLPDDWSPHTWQPFFGEPKVILDRGVRGFWGQYWHQAMRVFVSAPGEAIADLLKLNRGSTLRYVVLTTTAFGLSGIIHMGLVPPDPLHSTMEVNAIRLHIGAFFWIQPLAIIAEVCSARMVSRCIGLDVLKGVDLTLKRAVNLAFFVMWFTFCIPFLGEAVRQLGYWRVWPVPVSLWRGLRGEGWILWP